MNNVNLPILFPYEIMERTTVLMNSIEDSIMDHPYLSEHPETIKMIEDAQAALLELYQHAAQSWHDETKEFNETHAPAIAFLKENQ